MLNDTQNIESYLTTNSLTKLILDSQSFDSEAEFLWVFGFESFNNEALLYFSGSGWGFSFIFNHTYNI